MAGRPSDLYVYAKHGRPNRPIVIKLKDKETGAFIESRSLSDQERGTALPAEQPWVVGIGSAGMGLDIVASNSVKAGLADYTTTEITDARSLPISAIAWDGVDLVVLSSGIRSCWIPFRKSNREEFESGSRMRVGDA